VIIRCERCSTLYELDEALLAPEGSPVQCTRCQAVFTARPPMPAARTLVGAPAPTEPGAAAPVATPTATPVPIAPAPMAAPGTAPPAAPTSSSASPADATAARATQPHPPGATARPEGAAAAPRPARTGPAVYRPRAPAAPPAVSRPPTIRRDTVGAFEARLRASNLLKRLVVPLTALVLVAAVAGGWALWRRRPDPEVARLQAEVVALLAQDDVASLGRAVDLCDAALARNPGQLGALADRALARVLSAAAAGEELEPVVDRLAAAVRERDRLRSEPVPVAAPRAGQAPAQGAAPGSEEPLRAAEGEVARLEADVAGRRTQAEALAAQGLADLRGLAATPGGEQAAARGLAVAFALAGDGEQVARQAAVARGSGADPWADLAEAWVLARQDQAARDQATKRLQALVVAHPELIRARLLLARAQAAAGRREEAEATVVGLLAANPRHERAQRLKARLAMTVTAVPAGPPPPAPAPPARPTEWRRPVVPVPAPPPAAVEPASAPAAPAPAEAEPTPAAPVAVPEPAPAAPSPAPPPPPPPPRRQVVEDPLEPVPSGGG